MFQFSAIKVSHSYGLFTLPNTDSDLDSKPDGYIMLCRKCSHCTDSDSDSDPDPDPKSLLYPFLGWISVLRSGSDSLPGSINKQLLFK